jgi:hypothetical protein
MNQQEYEVLQNIDATLISADLLTNKSARTLLYGYTIERDTWHVYLDQNGVIQTVKYGYGEDSPIYPINVKWNDEYIPSKRLYAEKCDFEFCFLLKQRNISLNFTTATFEKEFNDQYHGRVI